MLKTRVIKEIGPGRRNKTSNNASSSSSNGSSNSNSNVVLTPNSYSHIRAMSKNILSIEQGPELDFLDDFEDSRLELKSTGHNLTSVLINPRESMLDSILDEFELDQSIPLDITPLTSPNPYQSYSPLISSSSSSSSTSSTSSTIGESLLLFPPTNSSDFETLAQVISRMKRIYSEYIYVHNNDGSTSASSSSSSKYNNIRMDCSTARTAEDLATCFQVVPDLFFKNSFTLQNADIFNDILGPVTRGAGHDQEQELSKYLDLVEMALLKQIWIRSPAFFRALDDIKGLKLLVSQATNHLMDLRQRLQTVDDEVAVRAMRIPQIRQRQQNEVLLCDKLMYMQQVLQAKNDIQQLLESEDYLGALDVASLAKNIFNKQLVGIVCMRKVGDQLEEYENLVCEVLCNRFISAAIHFESDDEMLGISNKDSNQQGDLSLEQILLVLLQANRLHTALMMYKTRLGEVMRLIVRTCILEYLTSFDPTLAPDPTQDFTSAGGENDTPFAQRVREMPDESFLYAISLCFEQLLNALKRCENVHNFIELKAKTVDDTKEDEEIEESVKSTTSNNNNNNVIDTSRLCLTSSCDVAQRSIQQLLSLRRESNIHLNIEKMKFLWECCFNFILSAEKISSTSAYDMRRCLTTQTKDFLVTLHENSKRSLQVTLDAERWTQCDVSPERQKEINLLAAGKAFFQRQQDNDDNKTNKNEANESNNNNIIADGVPVSSEVISKVTDATAVKKKEFRPAYVDNAPFKAAWSALFVTEMAMTYVTLTIFFPSIVTDVIIKMGELIKLFDKRTRELVLSAEAIESSAKLKSISAKHLAITAQSLGFLSALLPHFRAALLAQLPPNLQMQLAELDRVSLSLIDHHGLIVDKLVEIAAYAVESSASGLKKVDWDRFQGQCEYFVEIYRNISALHRVLLETLPGEQLQDIFSRIFASLSRRLPSHFEDIMPLTQTGKQRILDEVTHLISELYRLKQVETSGIGNLEEIFRKKYSN